ncbi:MAG: CheR family methyltransferase [Opitutaceae bacterium]|jgi:chemotaxis protein methyltransferase WspC
MTDAFEVLLKQTMGLDASSIGPSSIERAVQQRLAACGLANTDAYLDRVRASADEVQELIEAVVVPETWFFRDREAFTALARLAFEDWLRTHPEGVLRVLSLPCSTGEEPYSVAMALLDAGFSPERFRVDALDISARSLVRARSAVFGRNSFRGGDQEFRDRHFTPAGAGWQLSDAVRRQVEFHQGNILDENLRPGAGSFDIVFCRNLLIYFDRATQDRAVAMLMRLLAPKGWLFVGPSETGLLLRHAFVSAKIPLAFAFRHADAVPSEPKSNGHAPAPRKPAVPRVVAPSRAMPFSSVVLRSAGVVAEPVEPMKSELDRAMQLADQGRLVEAVKACESHVHVHGPSAQAFYVMGLVRDASGSHTEASEFYRKALYLDPQHHDALVQLALLLEGQGDKAGAKVMSDRARRIEQREVK